MEQEVIRPRKKQDFNNGKIYIIRNSINDLTYIGSTCQSLSQRMVQHRKDMNIQWCQNFKLYQAMRELDKNNFYIELLENYPCNTRDELNKKEGEYIREYQSKLNKQVAGRSQEQYRRDIREQLAIRKKEEYQRNKEQYKKTGSEYREKNKEHRQIKAKERYEFKKDEIKSKKRETYHKHKEEINQKRRERMKQKKETDADFRNKLKERQQAWYAKNRERQCQYSKEYRQMKKQQEQPEQEPEVEEKTN